MKKTFAILLTLVMSLGIVFVPATAVEYPTFDLVMTDNGDGTVTVTAYAPADVFSGKIVISNTDNLQYIPNSAEYTGSVFNDTYSKNGVKGVCLVFAFSNALTAKTSVLSVDYSIVGDAASASDIFSNEWNLTDGTEFIANQNNGPVNGTYIPKTYTVKFYGFNNELLKQETVVKGENATAPEAPVVTGYTFTGWDKAFDNVTDDINVTAIYTVKTFTVCFYNYDDSLNEWQTVEYGKSATEPEGYAENDGYFYGNTFVGWSVDFSCVTSDLHVYPLFQPKNYTVTFVGFNGKVIATETVQYCYPATAPQVPVVEGYTFTGWDKSFDSIREDITVTANYSINTYTVTFVAAEGGQITGNTSITVDYGTKLTDSMYPTYDTDDGYSFDAWQFPSDYDAEKGVTGDIIVTASFKTVTEGDVNNDGYIDNMDAALILKYDAGIIDANYYLINAGDVNNDGYVDNIDAALIIKYDAGILDTL